MIVVVGASCGDPILERAERARDPTGAGTEPAQEPTPGPAVAPPTGLPEPPTPGVPAEAPPRSPTITGPTTRLSGRVTAPEGLTGPIRVDVFDGDQRELSGPRPKVVAVGHLAAAGEFELLVPQGQEKLWLGAYQDLDGNGRPDPTDPVAWYGGNPISSDQDQGALDLDLKVQEPPAEGG